MEVTKVYSHKTIFISDDKRWYTLSRDNICFTSFLHFLLLIHETQSHPLDVLLVSHSQILHGIHCLHQEHLHHWIQNLLLHEHLHDHCVIQSWIHFLQCLHCWIRFHHLHDHLSQVYLQMIQHWNLLQTLHLHEIHFLQQKRKLKTLN